LNDKDPSQKKKHKIEEIQTRLVGLAHSQGWLVIAEPDIRASLLCPTCDVENPAHDEEVEQHHPPSLKTFCISCCGCCPFKLCTDDIELEEAKTELEEAETELHEINVDLTGQKDLVIAAYAKKGLSKKEAEDKIAVKVNSAEARVEKAKERMEKATRDLETKKQTKFSESVGACQTAIAMPCMIGL
jgi:hypothetical protein